MYIKILCLRTLAKPIRINGFNKQWLCKGNWPFSCDRGGARGGKGESFKFPKVAKNS